MIMEKLIEYYLESMKKDNIHLFVESTKFNEVKF